MLASYPLPLLTEWHAHPRTSCAADSLQQVSPIHPQAAIFITQSLEPEPELELGPPPKSWKRLWKAV